MGLPAESAAGAAGSEAEIRRRLDRAVLAAASDTSYAAKLIAEPTSALELTGCTPQQWLDLNAVRASDLPDFARKVQALFWAGGTRQHLHAGRLARAAGQ